MQQIIQVILASDADVIPDYDVKTLRVNVEGQATLTATAIFSTLFDHMNETKTIYQQADFTVIFKTG